MSEQLPDWARETLDAHRADLYEVVNRHAIGLDENRPQSVARRRKINSRTARENVADLCDPDSFIEYGALAIAAQRRRRSVADLMEATPADGMIAGMGTVNAAEFGAEKTRCAVLAYDYTVLAGTQGHFNHKKKDRLFELAEEWSVPVVFFTEGGGGRPGDVDTELPGELHYPRGILIHLLHLATVGCTFNAKLLWGQSRQKNLW